MMKDLRLRLRLPLQSSYPLGRSIFRGTQQCFSAALLGLGLIASLVVPETLAQPLAQTQMQPLKFESNGQAKLVEVYTSEGCSSCPPADRWLQSLSKDPRVFQDFVPIGFHVDYWNYIGWPDPFSHQSFSSRQRQWNRLGNLPIVATPTVMVSGEYYKRWRYQPKLPATKPAVPPAAISVEWTPPSQFNVIYNRNNGSSKEGGDDGGKQPIYVNACVLARDVESVITRGENTGKTLRHDFIATGCVKRKMFEGDEASYQQALFVPTIVEADLSEANRGAWAFAVWFTESESLEAIHVLGGSEPLGGIAHR